MCARRDWVFSKSAGVGRRRKVRGRITGSGKSKEGHEGVKGHLCLPFLSLLPAPVCIGSSKCVLFFFGKFFTLKIPIPPLTDPKLFLSFTLKNTSPLECDQEQVAVASSQPHCQHLYKYGLRKSQLKCPEAELE